MNPWSVHAEGRLDPLDAGRVRLERATILARDFAVFLRDLKGFKGARVELENGAAVFTFRQPGPDMSARVRVLPARGRPFALEAEDVRLGGVPVPVALVNWVIRNYDPSLVLAARLPVPAEMGRVEITPDAVRISPRR